MCASAIAASRSISSDAEALRPHPQVSLHPLAPLHGLRADEVSKLNVGDYQTQIVAGYASKQLHIREAKANSTGWVVLFAERIAEFEAYLA